MPVAVGRILRAPLRAGSILDEPIEPYLLHVDEPAVARLFREVARRLPRPATLRALLQEAQFTQWRQITMGEALNLKVERELLHIANIVEEEYVLDAAEPRAPSADRESRRALEEWARSHGVRTTRPPAPSRSPPSPMPTKARVSHCWPRSPGSAG